MNEFIGSVLVSLISVARSPWLFFGTLVVILMFFLPWIILFTH